jgi:hypothetical protein
MEANQMNSLTELVPRGAGPMIALIHLRACYGQRWRIRRASTHVWTAEQTVGTRTRILAGTPAQLLAKLDAMPSGPGPAVLIIVPAGYLSGAPNPKDVS